MAVPYSQDLRDRVLAAYDRGEPTKQIARSFLVSPAWARWVKQTRPETGWTTPLPMRSLAYRTKDALWNAIQSVLDLVTPSDAANCFRHCGYTLRND